MAEKLGLWNYPPFIGQQGPGVARMVDCDGSQESIYSSTVGDEMYINS